MSPVPARGLLVTAVVYVFLSFYNSFTLAAVVERRYGAVVRGDGSGVSIGAASNVQDHVVIQTTAASTVTIGASVTIGHNAVLTGCTVGDGCLIGMGAVIGEGATVEPHAMVRRERVAAARGVEPLSAARGRWGRGAAARPGGRRR